MIKKKKILIAEDIPEFRESIDKMPADSKIFVDKSMEIAHHIFRLMEERGMKQKELAAKMGKSEAEISKMLAGMHNLTLRSIAKLEAAFGETIICTPRRRMFAFPEKEVQRGGVKDIPSASKTDVSTKFQVKTKIVDMFSHNNGGTELQVV